MGVVGDVRQAGLDRDTLPDIYYPMAQNVAQIADIGMTLVVSTHVPAPALTRLRTEVGRWLADADTVAKLRGLGGLQPFVTAPEEFAAFVRSEHAKYGQVVKAVGVKVD